MYCKAPRMARFFQNNAKLADSKFFIAFYLANARLFFRPAKRVAVNTRGDARNN